MKIFFDKQKTNFEEFKTEKILLSPFFEREVIQRDKEFINSDKWIEDINNIISYADEEHADVFVYQDKLDTDIVQLYDKAKFYNKRIIAFYNDDDGRPSCLPPHVDLYRTSLYRSKQKKNEFALPAWSCDFMRGSLPAREKKERPVVGFCGAITHYLRFEAINMLKANDNITTNIILRASFWGGDTHNINIRGEYINNLLESDIVPCIRGGGNFSYRLYETMSLGRIPLIVNTDLVLPCNDFIDWNSIAIIVADVKDINGAINNFWYNISPDDYIAQQRKIRDAYERYICPSGFTKYLSLRYTGNI